MERILILGGNGTGKTTLSKMLSHNLGLPLTHLDVLFWRDNWKTVSKDEFDKLLIRELKKEKWIIDGNFFRTIPLRLNYCDTVIYFDYSTVQCLYGVIKRVIKNYGKSRDDMGGYCPERFDLKFLKNVLRFNKKNRKRIYELLNNTKDVNVIVLKNNKDVQAFLKTL